MSKQSGDGVELSNITIRNWKGTEANGAQRGPIKIICPDGAPCYDINIEDFAMWTEEGDEQWYSCQSAYGSGFCLQSGSDYSSYEVTTTTATSAPSGYSAATMASDLATNFGSMVSIPIPTIPTSFYPGATPYSALLAEKSSTSANVRAVTVSAHSAVPAATGSASSIKEVDAPSSGSSTPEIMLASSSSHMFTVSSASPTQVMAPSAIELSATETVKSGGTAGPTADVLEGVCAPAGQRPGPAGKHWQHRRGHR